MQKRESHNETNQIIETAQRLAAWDIYDQNSSAPWFNPEWMFGIANGFDIVIGNPPYGAELSKSEIEYFKKVFKLKTAETAILFVEKGHNLLCQNGIETYIVPKSLTFASNYITTRNYIENELSLIVDCGKAFDEVRLEACVFLLQKSVHKPYYASVKYEDDSSFKILSNIDKKLISIFGFYPNGISQMELEIGLKVLGEGQMLKHIAVNSRGEMLQQYIGDIGELEVIGGKEIDRYGIKGFKGKISKKYANSDKSRIKKNSILAQNIIAHITKPYDQIKIIACIPDKLDCVIIDTINQITIANTEYSNSLIWSLLNSKLINWYAYLFIFGKAIRTMHFDNAVTDRIPIRHISLSNQKPFTSLVERIIEGKKNGEDTSAWEAEIDALVYALYGLSEEEIAVVEGRG